MRGADLDTHFMRRALGGADLDTHFMRRALELAEAYRGRTRPNPIVGCVIVDANGAVLAEGAHEGPGHRHAEIVALEQLPSSKRKRAATMYVTLEPCTHQGRTPPCAPIVIASKIPRVVVGSRDPIPGHGGGIERLEAAGITIARALVDECDAANRPFLTWALHGRPAFTLKAAITLDGKIATVGGESKWITGEQAREHVHRLRDTHDAVLVGIGTVLADDPQLTARVPGGRNPIRIVIDSKLRTPPSAKVVQREARTIIATTATAPVANAEALVAAGAEVWRFESSTGHVPLDALAKRLAEQEIQSVLVEGGGQVHAALLAAGLADVVVLYIAPTIVGGPAPSWVGGQGVAKLGAAYGFEMIGAAERLGPDLLVRLARR